MIPVLNRLEHVKAKLMYAVAVGHTFVPVSRLMLVINKITRILGHYRPVEYKHPDDPHDTPQRKVWTALDEAHRELFDLLTTRRAEVIQKIGADKAEDLHNLMAELSYVKDKAYDAENGPGASLLKRGRKFNVASLR